MVSSVSDVVISFVKKTVAGVAGLLRLRSPLTTKCEKPRRYEEPQVSAPTPANRHNLSLVLCRYICYLCVFSIFNYLTFPLLIQPVTLMGIDELHTSWLNSTEWRMSK